MSEQKKVLGLWMLISLVAGNMVGSGVFLLPASLAAIGSISLVSWGITAGGAILLALVFARLSRVLPKTGGPYAYCVAAYGDFVGFQVAYNYWMALWIGNAAIVVAFVGYCAVFWPQINTDHHLSLMISLGVLWFVTIINVIGVKAAGRVQVLTTILKLLPLIAMAAVGIFFIHPSNLASFNISGQSHISALTAAATLTLWSFIGFESATVPADSVINPTKNIPRATIIGTLIAAGVYILGSVTVMGVVPMAELAQSSSPYADAAKAIFGHWGGLVIAIAAIIACFGTLNGWILMQGQVPLAAAEDQLFPKAFGRLNKQGTPAFGLIVSSVLISLLLIMRYSASLVDQFTFVILLATLASLIPYLYTTMAELMIVYKSKQVADKPRLVKLSILSLLTFGYVFWAIMGAGTDIVFYGAMLLLSSVPLYVWIVWRRKAS